MARPPSPSHPGARRAVAGREPPGPAASPVGEAAGTNALGAARVPRSSRLARPHPPALPAPTAAESNLSGAVFTLPAKRCVRAGDESSRVVRPL